MNLSEALNELKKGKYVRENNWPPSLHLRLLLNTENKDHEIVSYQLISIPFVYTIDILTKDDKWKHYENNDDELNFIDALSLLDKGEKVQLSHWDKDSFIIMERGTKNLILKKMEKLEWTPTTKCFLSNDWRIFEW